MQPPLNYDDPQLINQMAQLAGAAMSPNMADRGVAEQQVKVFQDSVDGQAGFVALLLSVIQKRQDVALFCSIVLKNTVKKCWNPATAEHCVQEGDKQLLRATIIAGMFSTSGPVQRNLAETVALIADVDFPAAWPDALTLIISTLGSDAAVETQCAALSTAHSILVKYREVSDFTESFVVEMCTIYSLLLGPLLSCIARLLQVCETQQTPEATAACQGLVSAAECLIDITSLDLADEFVLRLKDIVGLLLRCLALQNPYLLSTARHDGGPLVALKSQVTSCVSRFLTNYDEDFDKYAGSFLQVVWDIVADPANAAPSMDDLVIRGLEMLSNACAGTARSAFDDAQLLLNLVERAIIPNLVLQEDDIEMYETEPDAYIQRDIEGSDLHTRRRAAGELVRTLVKTIPDKARPLLSAEAGRLLSGGSAPPAPPGSPTSAALPDGWRAKDAGIFLTSSLALEGQHVDAQRGAAQLSDLVPFEAFLNGTILPELFDSGAAPSVVKADCIRVVATFRDHINAAHFPAILQALPRWMAVDDPVCSTYAAHAVDRLLLAQQGQQYVVTEAMFAPLAGTILQTLCQKLEQSEQPNAYFAQCLMRIFLRVPATTAAYLESVIVSVGNVLTEAAKNPSNPLFSHCLFEVVSKCIAQHPQFGAAFEQVLWPCLSAVLANNVAEYMPYTLQIFAQLLGTHPKGAAEPPEHYKPLLPPLTEASIYEQRGNIPAVVCLLTRFIACYPAYVHGQGLSERILAIFRMLVQLKTYDHEGLNILTTMMLYYPAEAMGRYLTASLQVLLQRLQVSRTPKFVRILIIFLSITVCMRGASDPVTRMNQIQDNLFFMILDKVWLPNMQKVSGKLERKVCIVALARLLTESPELQLQPQAWAQSAYNCLRMIHDSVEADDHTSFAPQTATINDLARQQGGGGGGGGSGFTAKAAAAPGGGVGTMGEAGGFTNVFCPLEDAIQKPVDVCESIADPDQYFRVQMKQLLSSPSGGPLLQVLQSTLQPNLLALIQ